MKQFFTVLCVTILSVSGMTGVIGLWEAYLLWSTHSLGIFDTVLFASMALLITCSYERLSVYYSDQFKLVLKEVV